MLALLLGRSLAYDGRGRFCIPGTYEFHGRRYWWINAAFLGRNQMDESARPSHTAESTQRRERRAIDGGEEFEIAIPFFFDEVEAAGAELPTEVNHRTTTHVKMSNRYKYPILPSGQTNYYEPRPFGGVNTFLFGDFWQNPPTDQIAIMSYPFSRAALDSATATAALNMFWKTSHPDALQPWDLPKEPRVLHLDVNYRSKQDVWFSHVLDQCRLGALSLSHYNYLHGLKGN